MRAERLMVQAFGCYLKEIQVDFSALNGNLFLITGATGGGKTTLLTASVSPFIAVLPGEGGRGAI